MANGNQSALQGDSGSEYFRQRPDVDTSRIFIGSSMDYATGWRDRKGGGSPNPAALGRGNLLPNDSAPTQPVEVR